MWSIAFRVVARGLPWTLDELRTLRDHAERWSRRLSRNGAGYDLTELPAHEELDGTLRPGGGRDAARDYVTLVRALVDLERLFPGLEATVWDRFYVPEPRRPGTVQLQALRQAVLEDFDPVQLDDEERELEQTLARAQASFDEWLMSSSLREKLAGARRDFEEWKRAQPPRLAREEKGK